MKTIISFIIGVLIYIMLSITLCELVWNYNYRYEYLKYPVHLVSCIFSYVVSAKSVKETEKIIQEWIQ